MALKLYPRNFRFKYMYINVIIWKNKDFSDFTFSALMEDEDIWGILYTKHGSEKSCHVIRYRKNKYTPQEGQTVFSGVYIFISQFEISILIYLGLSDVLAHLNVLLTSKLHFCPTATSYSDNPRVTIATIPEQHLLLLV